MAELYYQLNTPIFLFLNQQLSVLGEYFWRAVTLGGDTFIEACLVLILLPFIKFPTRFLLVSSIMGAIISRALKLSFDFSRPSLILKSEYFHQFGPELQQYALPSGHTFGIFFSVTLVLGFIKESKTILIALYTLALLVGISRVAVGAHWPADVFMGALFGILVGRLFLRMKNFKYFLALEETKERLLWLVVSLLVASFPIWGKYPPVEVNYEHPIRIIFGTFLAVFVMIYFFSVQRLKRKSNS